MSQSKPVCVPVSAGLAGLLRFDLVSAGLGRSGADSPASAVLGRSGSVSSGLSQSAPVLSCLIRSNSV